MMSSASVAKNHSSESLTFGTQKETNTNKLETSVRVAAELTNIRTLTTMKRKKLTEKQKKEELAQITEYVLDHGFPTGWIVVHMDISAEYMSDRYPKTYITHSVGPTYVKTPDELPEDRVEAYQELIQQANNVRDYIDISLQRKYTVENICEHH